MSPLFPTINAFIEDTCVLIALAYVATRVGASLLLPHRRRSGWDVLRLSLILGLAGVADAVIPTARSPYVTHTLVITFATLAIGLEVGLTVSAVVILGALLFQPPLMVAGAAIGAASSLAAGSLFRRIRLPLPKLLNGLMAGMLAQAFVITLCALLPNVPTSVPHALASIPANGIGIALLQLIVGDAQVRAEAARNRIELERSKVLLAEMQNTVLRARMRPHFLFNTLTSVAGLCGIDPVKAEMAVVRLGQLMRCALETDAKGTSPLNDELDCAQSYLWIEQQRLGARIRVDYDIDRKCTNVPAPSFSVQTLVENAVNHGIAPQPEGGRISIIVRPSLSGTLVAVRDDGVGMTAEQRTHVLDEENAIHGLQILNQQLVLQHGPRSRPRLFSKLDSGTLAVFVIPSIHSSPGNGRAQS